MVDPTPVQEISDEEAARRYRARRLQFVKRLKPRTYVPRYAVPVSAPLFTRVVAWLLPWSQHDYPGKRKGIAQALQGRRTVGTCVEYLKGRRRLPEEIAVALADLVRARVEAGQALLRELEAYAARPSVERLRRRRAGFMRIDPATGLSGRSDVGKRRGVRGV